MESKQEEGGYFIAVTSTSQVKLSAVKLVLKGTKVIGVNTNSDVSEQPVGRFEIRTGALNRLECMKYYPAVSFETGMVKIDHEYCDITCCILRTRYGTFESWSEPVKFNQKVVEKWKLLPNRRHVTIGSLMNNFNSQDWYIEESRSIVMGRALYNAFKKYEVVLNQMPDISAPSIVFNGVNFLDIQGPMIEQPKELVKGVRRLCDRLLFNTVVVIDARGFLFASEFMREGIKVVMVRKQGKLPRGGEPVEYKKEYGADKLVITNGSINYSSRVVVIDDLIATGGSMLAAERLINKEGGEVVCFVAPFVIQNEDGQLMCDGLHNVRYLSSEHEIPMKPVEIVYPEKEKEENLFVCACCCNNERNGCREVSVNSFDHRKIAIACGSMMYFTTTMKSSGIQWKQFHRSSNMWLPKNEFLNQDVYVFLDPSNPQDSFDILQILTILYRKEPNSITVVIPFLEQATQDRIEYNSTHESVAQVDTLAKLIGHHKVVTFDIHALQSVFAFHNICNLSLVEKLWEMYLSEYPDAIPVFPDEGAYKRFGHLPGIKNPIVFKKIRDGHERKVEMVTNVMIKNTTKYVVIDDIVRSGGTMKSIALFLEDSGACWIDALFAHAAFDSKACVNMKAFDDIWTSNSCPRIVPDEWIKVRVQDML